jgi:hypothetical protein
MEANLIPCPDCGSPAELKKAYYFGVEQMYSYVHCTNPDCPLYARNPHFSGSNEGENDKHAIESWNEHYSESRTQGNSSRA